MCEIGWIEEAEKNRQHLIQLAKREKCIRKAYDLLIEAELLERQIYLARKFSKTRNACLNQDGQD